MIEFISLDEFATLGLKPSNVFGSIDFLRINASKAEDIICAVNDDGKIGIALGKVDKMLCAPWSAPYLSLNASIHDEKKTEIFGFHLREQLLDKSTRLIFPPEIHLGIEFNFLKGFYRKQDKIITDTSFYINLEQSGEESHWNKSARRNLKRAENAGLKARLNTNPQLCYELIARHHKSLGYRMAMTCDEVMATANILPIDFWIAFKDESPVAAMYCYRVRPDMVQVIASGDTPDGRQTGAAIFMERIIIDHYREVFLKKEGKEKALLDHGPTSVGGVQNEGLAAFKSSFGCLMTPKITLTTIK